ncbi:hypothetical protein D3C85_1652340 [compost metagenome]
MSGHKAVFGSRQGIAGDQRDRGLGVEPRLDRPNKETKLVLILSGVDSNVTFSKAVSHHDDEIAVQSKKLFCLRR